MFETPASPELQERLHAFQQRYVLRGLVKGLFNALQPKGARSPFIPYLANSEMGLIDIRKIALDNGWIETHPKHTDLFRFTPAGVEAILDFHESHP